MALAIFSGAVFYENFGLIIGYLSSDSSSLSEVGNIFLFISSILAIVYTALNMLYVFKGRQDGSLMMPLSIFGGAQLIFILVMRIIFLVRAYKLYQTLADPDMS